MTGLIIYDDRFRMASLTASSVLSGYPVENLQTEELHHVWMASSAAQDAHVVVDFGEEVELSAWAVLGHNIRQGSLTGGGNIRLSVGSTDNGSTFDTHVDYFIDFWSDLDNPWPHLCGTFEAVSKRYWRVKVYGTPGTTCDWEIAAIMLGQYVHLPTAISAPYNKETGDTYAQIPGQNSYTQVIDDGGLDGELGLVLNLAPASLVAELRAAYTAQRGSFHPVVFADHNVTVEDGQSDPDGPYPNEGELRYCTIESYEDSQLPSADYYQAKMTLRDVD